MKKLFSSIGILITLSLIGIIVMQISWLKNLIALREDQIKQKIDNAGLAVQLDLTNLKAQYTPPIIEDDINNIFPRRNYYDVLNPVTIGSKITATYLYEKIRKSFDEAGLKKLRFEFTLNYDPAGSDVSYPIRQSSNFYKAFSDSAYSYNKFYPILSPSGSASESLTSQEMLVITALNWRNYVKRDLGFELALAVLFTLVIVAAFYLTVYTMLRQKKLSDIKNDFINNMTHEFKTPIATISLAVDALKNDKVMADRDKMKYFSGIIKEENQRMNKQVETILKASQFEKKEAEIDRRPVSVHEILENVIDNFQLQLHDKKGDSELVLKATKDIINADEVHFTNLVNNLIDNAVKYSKENVPIKLKISTSNSGNKIVMRFEDNGIGMSKETQRRVFEKFYRAHTGNLHNVKGFGLGLSYVKSVADSHGGSIKVDSTLGKGSIFILEFPLAGALRESLPSS
ncbi:sensor histidine kinase [Niabella terrae]